MIKRLVKECLTKIALKEEKPAIGVRNKREIGQITRWGDPLFDRTADGEKAFSSTCPPA